MMNALQMRRLFSALAVAASAAGARAEGVPLFNGKDLAGWVPCNIAPEMFFARDGMIVTTG